MICTCLGLAIKLWREKVSWPPAAELARERASLVLFYEEREELARPGKDGTTAASCCATRAAHVTAHTFINIHFAEKNST